MDHVSLGLGNGTKRSAVPSRLAISAAMSGETPAAHISCFDYQPRGTGTDTNSLAFWGATGALASDQQEIGQVDSSLCIASCIDRLLNEDDGISSRNV